MSKILIDISAKKIWQKEEINLVRKVLLSCYASLSLKEYLELSVRLTDDKEIMDLNKKYRNNTISNAKNIFYNSDEKDVLLNIILKNILN